MPNNATDKTILWSSNKTNVVSVDKDGKLTANSIGTAIITAQAGDKKVTCNVQVVNRETSIKYKTHVQNIGWQGYVKNGATSGTTGKSLRLEGINISLDSPDITGGIEYRTHIQNVGWQSYVSNGAMSGTSGKSLRLEAIQIRLTGNIAKEYDVYYRVHAENFGWLGWAKNGDESGSAGFSYRLEAIQILIVKKGSVAPGSTKNSFKQNILYKTHIQNIGWQNYVNSTQVSGTTGQALRLEGIKIMVPENINISGNVEYSVHVQNIGWQNFVRNNAMAGTSNRNLRLEAIKIRLTDNLAKKYDIYYRVHCENFGWLGWAKNGEKSGSAGYSYRLEGIQIMLVKKGDDPPGSTAKCYYENCQ